MLSITQVAEGDEASAEGVARHLDPFFGSGQDLFVHHLPREGVAFVVLVGLLAEPLQDVRNPVAILLCHEIQPGADVEGEVGPAIGREGRNLAFIMQDRKGAKPQGNQLLSRVGNLDRAASARARARHFCRAA